MPGEVVRIGLVGAGAWGRNYLRTASAEDGLVVSAVLRSSLEPVEGFPDAPLVGSLGELLACCDAVVVSTPPDSHGAAVTAALRAGLPTLVEKPAALDLASVRLMFSASSALGVPLLVNHVHLFSPAFCVMREWTRGWASRRINSVSGADGPFRSYPSLLDWGPHDVSMCLSLFMAPPEDLEASSAPSLRGEMHDLFMGFGQSFANLRFGNGLAEKTKSFSVSSPDGEASYDGLAQSLTFNGKVLSFGNTTPLREALLVLRAVALGDRTDWRLDPWLPLETSRVLDEAARLIATRSGRLRLPR